MTTSRRKYSLLLHLEKEVLDMIQAERLLRADNAMQVRLHQIRHDVNVLELLWRRRDQDIQDANDLLG